MRVALIQTPAFGIDRPPIALSYLVSYVEKHGFSTDTFDLNIDFYSQVKEEDKKLWDFRYVFEWMDENIFLKDDFLPEAYFGDWSKKILDTDPDVIGFSVQSSSLRSAVRLAKVIKENAPEKAIIFGGPLNLSYSIEHSYYLLQLENDNGIRIIDAVALGEGEETLVDILNRIKNKISLAGCQGVVAREKGEIINNGLRPLIKDLDALPFPDFSGFPDKYKYKNRIPILGSRGCIHKCVFCDDTLMWARYRSRSPENIIEEMRLRKKEGVDFLEFNDLLINGDLGQLFRLCDLIIKDHLDIPWGGSASVNRDMGFDFLKKMKMAGCRYLNYGIESASPKILREINKGFSIDEAKKVIEDTYESGISVCTNWIVGFPTESYADFKDTLNFVRENIGYLKNNIMVNSFIMKDNSLLAGSKEKFGITLKSGRDWVSCGGLNTAEERRRRLDEFTALLFELKDKPAHVTFQR